MNVRVALYPLCQAQCMSKRRPVPDRQNTMKMLCPKTLGPWPTKTINIHKKCISLWSQTANTWKKMLKWTRLQLGKQLSHRTCHQCINQPTKLDCAAQNSHAFQNQRRIQKALGFPLFPHPPQFLMKVKEHSGKPAMLPTFPSGMSHMSHLWLCLLGIFSILINSLGNSGHHSPEPLWDLVLQECDKYFLPHQHWVHAILGQNQNSHQS